MREYRVRFLEGGLNIINMEEKIKTQFKCALITLDSIIKLVEENKLVNEQWFLDFQDKLNELSVK